MQFIVDSRITASGFEIIDWPLSRVFLKDNANYPWLILVPRVEEIQEIDQLSTENQQLLMQEISALSILTKDYFKPDKLNVATLGNIVSQLHIHVVARFKQDTFWPHSIWQAAQTSEPYERSTLKKIRADLQKQAQEIIFQYH